MLGLPYDTSADVWSAGCTLFEIFTGKVLFPGVDNNDMLRLIFEVCGPYPRKLLRKATFLEKHFDENHVFAHKTIDTLTGSLMKRSIHFTTVTRNIAKEIIKAAGKCTEEELKSVTLLKNLIEACLSFDLSKRCTPDDALKHAFFKTE